MGRTSRVVGIVLCGALLGAVAPSWSQLDCSCGHPCDVVLDDTILSGDETIEACLTITAGDNVAIEPPATVSFRAGQSVALGPSFYVTADPLVAFTVQIDEALFCDETADGDTDTWDACLDCDDGAPSIHPDATEVCNGEDDDCDGDTDEGLLNTNPACGSAIHLGQLAGDSVGSLPPVTAIGEAWRSFQLVEGVAASNEDLTATITLTSPVGVDYDLYVTCTSCMSGLSVSSTNGPGVLDTVDVLVDDVTGTQQSALILLEIRYVSGTGCGLWTLQVNGDTDAPAPDLTCPTA